MRPRNKPIRKNITENVVIQQTIKSINNWQKEWYKIYNTNIFLKKKNLITPEQFEKIQNEAIKFWNEKNKILILIYQNLEKLDNETRKIKKFKS